MDIVAKLNAAVLAAQSDAATRQRLLNQGIEPPSRELQTPEDVRRLPRGRSREMVAVHQGRRH